jgi:hypothetical protein
MFRHLLAWLLVLSALCRPFAVAGQLPPEPRMVAGASHLTLHAQKKAHHHHADGSIGVDDSRESIKHIAIEGSAGAVAGFLSNPFTHFFPMASAPRIAEQRATPEPFLPRLRRPPRAGA